MQHFRYKIVAGASALVLTLGLAQFGSASATAGNSQEPPALPPNSATGNFFFAGLSNFGMTRSDDLGRVEWWSDSLDSHPSFQTSPIQAKNLQQEMITRQTNPLGIVGVGVQGILRFPEDTPDAAVEDLTCLLDVKVGTQFIADGHAIATSAVGVRDGAKWVYFGPGGSTQVNLQQRVSGGLPVGDQTLVANYDCGAAGVASLHSPVVVLPNAVESDYYSISVNEGAFATNDTQVTLSIQWPWDQLVDKVMISNDGGFAPTRTKTFDAVTGTINWRIDSLGDERTQRVVYVRFHHAISGWIRGAQVSDDIYLDTVPPVIASVSVAATRTLRPRVFLRLDARDNRSGVASVQGGSSMDPRRATTVKYSKKVSLPRPKGGIRFVRVQDGAGNWSRWARVQG